MGYRKEKEMNLIELEKQIKKLIEAQKSNEKEILKEMGYNVEIVPIELKLDENYILMTKDLL